MKKTFSGKFVVRVPKSLHRKLSELAEQEGVSLNQWINTVLAEAVGSSCAQKATQKADPQQANLVDAHQVFESRKRYK